jgi:antitoxin HicB
MNTHDINYYLNLPYTIEVIRDNDPENPGWVAKVAELSGCITQADTFEELGEMIDEAMHMWLEAALEDGIEIPVPRPEEDYSGKLVVRFPTSLHRTLALQAEREGVSLNNYINMALATYVGRESVHKVSVSAQERRLPGLSASAFQVLATQGLLDEAQSTDEVLVGNWLRRSFSEIEQAHAANQPQFALTLLENLLAGLSGHESISPVMEAFMQMLRFQCQLMQTQMQNAENMRQKAEFLHDQIDKMIGKVNQPEAGSSTGFRMNYAEVATHSESQMVETWLQTRLARMNMGTENNE